jgi:hypothetical protein
MPTKNLSITITSNLSETLLLGLRRIQGLIDRINWPKWAFCYCCGRTYNQIEKHVTIYHENGGYELSFGCFPLCEWCWSRLTIDERLPYYHRLIEAWRPIRPLEPNRFPVDWEAKILRAVRKGL